MSLGRPPKGIGHVDGLDGPEDLKRRLKVVLETIVGNVSVPGACAELGVSESRLHEMRREALVGALQALLPKPSGRPAKPAEATPREEELLARIDALEVDLQAALVRTELALAMPHLFRSKKNPRKRRPGTGGGDAT
jgi:hypothetical protein